MANFLTKAVNGLIQTVAAISSSAGAADAGKIIELDADGLLDPSFFPDGVAGNVKQNLTAGDGSGQVQLADNTSATTKATGFVKQAYAAAATDVAVHFSGVNDQVTATVGTTYFLGTAGDIVATPPAFAVGTICQQLGTACGTNELAVEIDQPIEFATQ